MMDEIENLIRNAKPKVPMSARENVLAHLRAHGVVVTIPPSIHSVPVRYSLRTVVLQVAALVVLALFSGIAAAIMTIPYSSPAHSSEVAAMAARVDALEHDVLIERKNMSEITELLTRSNSDYSEPLSQAVADTIRSYDKRRAQEWRERHVCYVRNAYADQALATVERLLGDLDLTPDQEKEVTALLAETGRQAEMLIGDFYSNGHHPDLRVGEHLAKLAADSEKKLSALLDQQQREKMHPGMGVISASPAIWAPSIEFRDDTDLDVWMNWMTATTG